MKVRETLRAGPPNQSHSELVLRDAVEHTNRQIESVCRHYVEKQTELGLDLREAEILLQLAFGLRSLSGIQQIKFLMHPSTQYWLAAMRRASGPADSSKRREFAQEASTLDLQILLAQKCHAQREVILDEEGGLRFPLFDRHIEFGKSRARNWLSVETSSDSVKFYFEDGMQIHLPYEDVTGEVSAPLPEVERDGFAVTQYAMLCNGAIQVQRRDLWLRPHWTGTNERTTGTRFFGASKRQYPANFNLSVFNEAMDVIESAAPEIAKDISMFTPVLVPRFTSPTQRIGFTVLSRQGAMFLDEDSPEVMAENIVHENAHVKLRYMQLADPILEDFYSSDSERYSVPWRPDPRPLPGILEGAYVFSNVLELRQKTKTVVGPHTHLERDIGGAIKLLSKHGNFTKDGRSFLAQLDRWHQRSPMVS